MGQWPLGEPGVSRLRDCSSGSSSSLTVSHLAMRRMALYLPQTLQFVPKSVSLTLSLNTLLTGPSVSGSSSFLGRQGVRKASPGMRRLRRPVRLCARPLWGLAVSTRLSEFRLETREPSRMVSVIHEVHGPHSNSQVRVEMSSGKRLMRMSKALVRDLFKAVRLVKPINQNVSRRRLLLGKAPATCLAQYSSTRGRSALRACVDRVPQLSVEACVVWVPAVRRSVTFRDVRTAVTGHLACKVRLSAFR